MSNTTTTLPSGGQVYETESSGIQYMEFHFGNTYFGVENFPKKCAEIAIQYAKQLQIPHEKAMDMGCAVGRSSFELGTYFKQVLGVDYSHNFVKICQQMQEHGQLTYKLIDEGKVGNMVTRTLKDMGLDKLDSKVEFAQGDACNLQVYEKDSYDLILGANLIDRLYDPSLFLNTVHQLLKPKTGLLVLTSPYTWLEEYTPLEKWVGGYYKSDNQPISTFEGLQNVFANEFELVTKEPLDVPFVIRETKRKHQHTVAQMTIWRRK